MLWALVSFCGVSVWRCRLQRSQSFAFEAEIHTYVRSSTKQVQSGNIPAAIEESPEGPASDVPAPNIMAVPVDIPKRRQSVTGGYPAAPSSPRNTPRGQVKRSVTCFPILLHRVQASARRGTPLQEKSQVTRCLVRFRPNNENVDVCSWLSKASVG